jgi:pyruvate carboxylase subunit B
LHGDLDVTTCRPADLGTNLKLRGEIEAWPSPTRTLTYAVSRNRQTWLRVRAGARPERCCRRAAQQSAPRYAADEFKSRCTARFHIGLSGSGRSDATQRPYFVSADGARKKCYRTTERNRGGRATARCANRRAPAAPARSRVPAILAIIVAMPGTVADGCEHGQTVKAGDGVLVIEAMKWRTGAGADGVVISIFAKKGDAVTPDMALVEIQPE